MTAIEREELERNNEEELERIGMSITRMVASVFGVRISALFSRSRPDHIVFPRQVAMKLMYGTGTTLEEVGEFFDRDHGTVIHAIRAVNNRCECNKDTRLLVEGLREAVNQHVLTPPSPTSSKFSENK